MNIKDIEIGRTYHNGKKRTRTVVGWGRLFIYYTTPSKKKRGIVTGELPFNFAKWAKGVVREC